ELRDVGRCELPLHSRGQVRSLKRGAEGGLGNEQRDELAGVVDDRLVLLVDPLGTSSVERSLHALQADEQRDLQTYLLLLVREQGVQRVDLLLRFLLCRGERLSGQRWRRWLGNLHEVGIRRVVAPGTVASRLRSQDRRQSLALLLRHRLQLSHV